MSGSPRPRAAGSRSGVSLTPLADPATDVAGAAGATAAASGERARARAPPADSGPAQPSASHGAAARSAGTISFERIASTLIHTAACSSMPPPGMGISEDDDGPPPAPRDRLRGAPRLF